VIRELPTADVQVRSFRLNPCDTEDCAGDHEAMPHADTSTKSPWFTRETSALVLIDHQIGTMQLVKNIASDAALRNAVLLAKAARTLGMPIGDQHHHRRARAELGDTGRRDLGRVPCRVVALDASGYLAMRAVNSRAHGGSNRCSF
jgi:hypothetical protein